MRTKDYWTEEDIDPDIEIVEDNYIVREGMLFSREAYEDFME